MASSPRPADMTRQQLASDDDPESTARAKGALQSVIDKMGAFEGEPVEVVQLSLSEAIRRAGLPEQPAPWVNATASEIAAGRRVVMDPRHSSPPESGPRSE